MMRLGATDARLQAKAHRRSEAGLSWISIVRLGLVQTALGAIIVLTTSTLNRVMVVEYALPAMLPGILVAIHHAVQMLRPRLGYGSDMGVRRTPWIIGGMAVLALGGVTAAGAVALMSLSLGWGVALAALGFFLVGLGVGAAGTSLLAMLASMVEPERRAPAATILWVMMIVGFAVTAGVAGKLLDPFSPLRLVAVTGGVSLVAFLLACVALIGIERGARAPVAHEGERPAFSAVLREVWADPAARRFTIFVFISMLAYSAADLVLEPFAGEVFGRSIGQSTALAGMQNGGTLGGMVIMAIFGSGLFGQRLASLRGWTVWGCIASAAALVALAFAPRLVAHVPLEVLYIGLGLANGAFAAAAIASMMQLAGAARTGTRMGLWGAAQAIAFALGGFGGTVICDLARWMLGSASQAYAAVFLGEAALFLLSALIATRLAVPRLAQLRMTPMKEAIS
ncbi:BCD family MFS transporter [Sediminicoccus rosea]|uniref:BCD family MFS transporter n=1 Tax=Sediminicoccus rosea TaxID=1225128 RepID=A0ABZ0PPD5_9PROT|nr:BCD family MFS transporter [Sediminicoccus rosea]WPB87598.1 BCD family MFS transporter [Sediminicoccus rosea]